jgi:hypothetical protein
MLEKLRNASPKLKLGLTSLADDLLVLAGCVCILVGLAQWNSTVTWVVAGGMLIVFGYIYGKYA